MGPEQTFVQSSVQTPLKALVMQVVGWQHCSGTQSPSAMQLLTSEPSPEVVTMAVVGSWPVTATVTDFITGGTIGE
jgi:hypothetical protein